MPLLFGINWAFANSDAIFPDIRYVYPGQIVLSTEGGPKLQHINPLIDIARVLFHEANIPWKSKRLPVSRMFQQLGNQVSDFSILIKSPRILECCVTSENPVFNEDLRVYHSSQSQTISSVNDLIGKSIITIQGYSYGHLHSFFSSDTNKLTIHTAPTHASAFSMLKARRADYLIDYRGASIEALSNNPISGITFDVLEKFDLYLVLSKNHPNARSLIRRLEKIAHRVDNKNARSSKLSRTEYNGE